MQRLWKSEGAAGQGMACLKIKSSAAAPPSSASRPSKAFPALPNVSLHSQHCFSAAHSKLCHPEFLCYGAAPSFNKMAATEQQRAHIGVLHSSTRASTMSSAIHRSCDQVLRSAAASSSSASASSAFPWDAD